MDAVDTPDRGLGDTLFRDVRCKDCLREQLTAPSTPGASQVSDGDAHFVYSEAWAVKVLDRGGSRTDRCARHRREHRQAIQGIAVAYIDLATIGSVPDGTNPTGPLGGLGEVPAPHRPQPVSVDLSRFQFGMTDDDIRKALTKLADPRTRVLVLKAGTGTGKSTFGPYRLMNPPRERASDEALLQLTKLGPIIVTEPRVHATTGVARFVGEKLVAGCKWKVCNLHGRFVPARDIDPGNPEGPDHAGPVTDACIITDCSDHIGPGYPVGYQVKDDKKQDDSCQLIYVTDGTMVNWLRDGRLSKIGTVIVDEAHERSVNIDFILGELKRQLPRYPHLRVIVTSATFDKDFFINFFGGPDVVASMDVPAAKSFGYGTPLFPYADLESRARGVPPCICPPGDTRHEDSGSDKYDNWLKAHWPAGSEADIANYGDLAAITRQLEHLRYDGPLCDDLDAWRKHMPFALVNQVVRMVSSLHTMAIPGDILAFLPTENLIVAAVSEIEAAIKDSPTDVFALIGSMPKNLQAEALAARPPGARRKVVIATNLAETSLTVEGVRFVVDSGIIAQSTWDHTAASGRVTTKPHSQAGIRQRWGRVGRDTPGWVFPLYTAEQFAQLPYDTPPAASRENLEKLVMTAKAGGVDNIDDFDWPIKHSVRKDQSDVDSHDNFVAELSRASQALRINGIVDEDGHLTPFGKEVQRFSVAGTPPASALAVMFADQLACVPEVITALTLLDTQDLIGKNNLLLDNSEWPPLLRAEAALRRRALFQGCSDDLDLVLRVAAAWDRADPTRPPWEATDRRRDWCWHWWLNPEVLQKSAESRHETLIALSPAMKEDVKRFIDVRLIERARAILSRAMTSLQYQKLDDRNYVSVVYPSLPPSVIDSRALMTDRPDQLIAMSRTNNGVVIRLKHLIRVLPWAQGESIDLFQLLESAALEASPNSQPAARASELLELALAWPVGLRFGATVRTADDSGLRDIAKLSTILPALAPPWVASPDDEKPPELKVRESNWLLGVALPDDERLALEPLDTADDPSDPEKGTEVNDDGTVSDVIGEIGGVVDALSEGSSANNIPLPRVKLIGSSLPAEASALYACVGYQPGVDDGRPVLKVATSLFAAEIDVPDHMRGRVKGQGQRNINRLRQMEGILACDFDGRDGPLLILGTSEESVKSVLVAITRSAQVTGQMKMPPGASPASIIGKGGSTIKRLREQSGCARTDFNDNEGIWELAAPSRHAIEGFIALASQLVPGCVGNVTSDALEVRDIVKGQVVADWREARFQGCSVEEWQQLLRMQLDQAYQLALAQSAMPGTMERALPTLVTAQRDGEILTAEEEGSLILAAPPPVAVTSNSLSSRTPIVAPVRWRPRLTDSRASQLFALATLILAYPLGKAASDRHVIYLRATVGDQPLTDVMPSAVILPQVLTGLAICILIWSVWLLRLPWRGRGDSLLAGFTLLSVSAFSWLIVPKVADSQFDVAQQSYDYNFRPPEKIPGLCSDLTLDSPDPTGNFRLAHVSKGGHCSDIALYRGWREEWRKPLGSVVRIYRTTTYNSVYVVWGENRARSAVFVGVNWMTGNRIWEFTCPAPDGGSSVKVLFAGSSYDQDYGEVYNFRKSYVQADCLRLGRIRLDPATGHRI